MISRNIKIYNQLFDLINTFESSTVAREVIQAAIGLKPSRLILTETNTNAIIEILRNYKIPYFVLDTPIYCLVHGKETTWSNRILLNKEINKFPKKNVQKNWCIYLDMKKQFKELKECDFGKDDNQMAFYLGIPECCSKFYSKYAREALLYDLDFLPFCFDNTNFNQIGWCNILSQYLGHCLFSHFPCSFECEKTRELSKNTYDLLKQIEIKQHKDFKACHFNSYLYSVNTKIVTPISISKKEDQRWIGIEDKIYSKIDSTDRKDIEQYNIKYLRRSLCSVKRVSKIKKENFEISYIFNPGMDI